MGCVIWQLLDSGPGIPERVVDILAGRQADNGKEIHVMGLRIVRQIVAAHGGHADFLKKEAGGYGVEFVLPVEG